MEKNQDNEVDSKLYNYSRELILNAHKESLNELSFENSKKLTVTEQDFVLKDPLVLDFLSLTKIKKYLQQSKNFTHYRKKS